MRNLSKQISDQLLPRISRPGQYVGLELNSRWCGVDLERLDAPPEVTVALAFPDTYRIGISHLGGRILYQVLNDTAGVLCDRTYCPMPDAERVMREREVPLFAWETRRAVADFDVVGFSLPHEICVTNVLTMLDLAGIPLHAAKRGRDCPIIVAGDALADNPEPMADFVDIFLPGDGEAATGELVKLVKKMKRRGAEREEMILEAARTMPSAYAPRFYEPRYTDKGEFAGLEPLREDVPAVINRARVDKLSDSPAITRPLVPLADAVHHRLSVEIMRGCPNGCRFCQAGYARLPLRHRRPEEIIATSRAALASSGWREVSLLSLSSSDYPRLDELISSMNDELGDEHISVSLPSLRVNEQLRHLPKLTSKVRKGAVTIAAEAGSERLREALGKNITEEDMLAGVTAAYRAGWGRVKVYFMCGLPGETDEDVDAIFHLCKRLSDARRDVDGHRGNMNAAVSWFVPKPHTPMQWCPMRDMEYYFAVRRRLRELSRRSPVNFKFHWIERSILEGVIARGDRRIGRAVEAAWRKGARLDSWDEHFDYTLWQEAFARAGVDPAAVTQRQIPLDAPLPWDHIKCFRNKDFLKKEYRKLQAVYK